MKEEVEIELNEYRLNNLEEYLDNEIQKKDIEVNDNKKLYGNKNEEEYYDITYLLNNLKKIKSSEMEGLEKVKNILSKRKTNK